MLFLIDLYIGIGLCQYHNAPPNDLLVARFELELELELFRVQLAPCDGRDISGVLKHWKRYLETNAAPQLCSLTTAVGTGSTFLELLK